MFDYLLIVCTGNVCRSPVAAAMLRERLPGRKIESAGLNALQGADIEKLAGELAAADNLDLSEHKGRQLSREMIQEADLILVMTEGQRHALGEKDPAALGKIMLFGKWLPNTDGAGQGMEIPDPYHKSREAFIHVHKLLRQAADSWQHKLGARK